MPDPVTPTEADQARLDQAVLAKAVRIYALASAPLGTHGEITEFGVARVLPDYQIIELLAGLAYVNWNTDLETITTEDVILAMGYDSEVWTEDKTAAVDRALEAARSWVASYLLGPVAIA